MTVDFVFDGPPGPEGPRFIETEDPDTGASIGVGKWLQRADGYWVLRVEIPEGYEEADQ